jgi:CubicO group peptidase (beta-lactamase class C family)
MTAFIKKAFLIILTGAFGYGVYYLSVSLPVITGYSAKMMCSCAFIQGRTKQDVIANELSISPLSLAATKINYNDATVEATVFGMSKKIAVYRKGLGCTLANEKTVAQLKSQQFILAAPPAVNTDSIAWPLGNKIINDTAINTQALQRVVDDAFVEHDTTKKLNTRAVLVVYNNKLVAEKYAPGFNKNTPMLSWSMAKSVTATLVGILAGQGKLNIQAPAPVAAWSNANDARHAITLQHLLQQTSGLDFEEDYTKSSNATIMLFKKADMGGYTARMKLKNIPGTVFYYSSGNSNLLSKIIRQTTGEAAYHSFPYQQLFYKIGMYSAVMEPDASGTFIGSSYMYATARDWARFGLLYLHNGIVNAEKILPDNWVQQTTQPAKAAPNGRYGYQFWLNAGSMLNHSDKRFTDAPADMFYADGYEGQFVFIIPSKKLVIVRLGLTQGDYFNVNSFIKNITAALP